VISFANISFDMGLWAIQKNALVKDDIELVDGKILMGIPGLATLHCIEKTANFDDGCVHFSSGNVIHPTENEFPDAIKSLLGALVKGAEIYRLIEFKLDLLRSYDDEDEVVFTDKQKALREVISAIALNITQINAYKQNYANVMNVLETMC